jgi:prepilin-type N-terminal cleavage/methylation domain-containing protein
MSKVKRATAFSMNGFSLLEVLVASAVLGVVMLVLLNTLSTSLSLWRTTESKSSADREARASQLLLAQDLASVVMPANPELWPRIVTNRTGRVNVLYLKFLTAKPPDYQSTSEDAGDVCYVEYAVLPSTNGPGSELRRLFWPSGKTFSEVISKTNFPSAPPPAQFQSLGLNLLPTNRLAARGLGGGNLANEANNTNFVLLNANMRQFNGVPSVGNYPAAIEVNFAVADPETLRNTNLLSNPNYILRNAGLYSTRVYLPKPPNAP